MCASKRPRRTALICGAPEGIGAAGELQLFLRAEQLREERRLAARAAKKLTAAKPPKRATGSGVKAAAKRGVPAVAAKIVGPTVVMHAAAYPRFK